MKIKYRNLATLIVVGVSLCLALITNAAQADTQVGGPITSNTTWTVANSPYIVIANIDVLETVTLEIEPGVVVKFNPGFGLQVNGTLIADGAPGLPIVFTSNSANPQPGDWTNVEFTTTAISTTVDANGNYLSGSLLRHCEVSYAGDEVEGSVVAHSQLIDHCLIHNNNSRGIWITGTEANNGWVTNSNISYNDENCSAGGIYAEHSILRQNQVTNNLAGIPGVGSGCSLGSSGGGVVALSSTIEKNIISYNSARIGGFFGPGRGGGISAENSIVKENTLIQNLCDAEICFGGGIFASGSDSIVNDNVIVDNFGQSGGGIYTQGSVPVIANFIRGNGSEWGGGIYSADASPIFENFIGSNSAIRGGGIFLDGTTSVFTNTIMFNRVYSTAADDARGAGIYTAYDGDTRELKYNLIVANSGNLGSNVGGLEFLNGTVDVKFNGLFNNEPFDASNLSSSDIDLTSNYWGTVSDTEILAQLHDWYDDSSLGRFLFSPFLTIPNADTALLPPSGLVVNDLKSGTINLSWDSHPFFTTGWSYKIYYDTDYPFPPFYGSGVNEGDSPINVNAQTSFSLTGIDPDSVYYFAVTVADDSGHESWYSNVADNQTKIYLPALLKQ